MRRWPAATGMPPARIRGLHRFLEHLAREGANTVAVPLPANSGSTLVSDGMAHWQLEPWMPGAADFRANPTASRLRAAMAALAQWHLAAARYRPRPDDAPWFQPSPRSPAPAVAERLEILEQATEPLVLQVEAHLSRLGDERLRSLALQILGLFRVCRATVRRDLLHARELQVPLHPCLRDIWHDHLLLEGDQVSGIIDPSACRTESVACDLSRLLGSLVADDSAQWDLALQEYHRWRPLQPSEVALTRVLDRSGAILSGWTWLRWLSVERRGFSDWNDVASRMSEIRDRMFRLSESVGRA